MFRIQVRNISAEQVKLAISNLQPAIVEFYQNDGKNYLKINDWQNLQSQLITIEQIQMQKRSLKNQRYQANMNYVALQNNYFFTSNQFGQNQGMMAGVMDHMQPNPYMMEQMPPMGQINLTPYQQNFMPVMNPQFRVPNEDSDQQLQN